MSLRLLAAVAVLSLAAPVFAASGSIHPLAIEIDASANLYPASNPCGLPGFVNGPILNSGATADWVRDCSPNTDPPSLVDSIATGIKTQPPNQTGAAAVGHWSGVRIVDGIAGDEQDIFLTGGKEDDLSTWNIGPGTVGSSKYDITQAYLANNQTMLFFGMERRGNNGTTAFDFEFNQAAPDPATPMFPTRTVGDVLFTFEMMGSGSSGSAVPHLFRWDGTKYVEQTPLPAGLIATINQNPTPAAPWGYVDSKGDWTTGTLPRFEFAEAAAPLSALPGINPCGGAAFVQVRTRSSATSTSDLKDTTKIFKFVFGGPSAIQKVAPGCSQFSYDGTGSRDTSGGTNLGYTWDFQVPAGVVLSGGGVSADPAIAHLYHASQVSGTIDVSMPTGVDAATIMSRLTVTDGQGGCTDTTGVTSLDVVRLLTPSANKTAADGGTLSVALAGSAPGATRVQFQRLSGANWVAAGPVVSANATTLVYGGFDSDAASTPIAFSIGADQYAGQQRSVQFRLHAERVVAPGTVCAADSAPVTVKKVVAVDP